MIRKMMKKYLDDTFKGFENKYEISSHFEKYKKHDKPSLVKFEFKGGKLSFDTKLIDIYEEEKDNRFLHTVLMFKKTLLFCKKNKLEVPDCTFFIFISDRFPFSSNLTEYPIFLYAKPIDINMPLFPDNTFECLNLDQKYTGKCYNWDDIKELMNSKCMQNVPINNIIYFKGSPTHPIRKDLAKFSSKIYPDYKSDKLEDKKDSKSDKKEDKKEDKLEDKNNKKTIENLPLWIKLDAWKNFEPIYEFCKYTHLLNLPGHYPWSNRFKYLFLTNSYIINVNAKLISLDKKYTNEIFNSFIDILLTKDDYINIDLNYYKVSNSDYVPKELIIECYKKNKMEFNKLIKQLTKIYNDVLINPAKYNEIQKRGHNIISKLTMDDIYWYIYYSLVKLSKIEFV
jgi:hypothetical protein